MAGVAAAQVGADGGIAAAPKSRQIARHLHRPLCRRHSSSASGTAPLATRDGCSARTTPADARRWSGPVRPHSRSRAWCRSVPRNGWAPHAPAAPQIPRQQVHHGVGKVAGGKILQRRLVVEGGRQPIITGGGERGIGQIGPDLALRLAQEHHAVAPLFESLRPWQFVEAGQSGPRQKFSPSPPLAPRLRRFRQRDSVKRAAPARPQRHGAAVEADFIGALDWSEKRCSISSCVIGAASRMRPLAAVPVKSPTAI